MNEEPLEVVVAHLDGYVRVKLRGDLTYQTTDEHAEALREVTDLRPRVELDLSDVDFVDSAGIRFLVTLAQAHEGPVRLENVRSSVIRILTVTGLSAVFDFDSH